MRQFTFRALIAFDRVEPRPGNPRRPAPHYENHTRALMIVAHPLRSGSDPARYFPTEIWWDDGKPLCPGDRAVVTVSVTDDEADAYFSPGHPFTLWSGGDVGHGTVSRRVFPGYRPS